MKKTLYLNGSDSLYRLSLDGPSLLITSPDTAARRIPVTMLGKVIVYGNITLESDTLTYLSENNIPVLLISKWARGESILISLNYSMSLPCIKLESIVRDEKKARDFIDWARRMRAFLQRIIAKKLYHYNCNISGDDYKKLIYMLMPENKNHWRIVKNILRMLFWSSIIEELINNQFNIHCGIMHNKTSFGLVRDYYYILHPETDLQALQFFRSDSVDLLINRKKNNQPLLNSRGIHNIVHRFENKQYFFTKMIKTISNKLTELLGKPDESKLSRLL